MIPGLAATMTPDLKSRMGKVMETSMLVAAVGTRGCPHLICFAAGHAQALQVHLQDQHCGNIF